ncbi:MAG: zinc ribbon domain-containing protein [Candidatus Rokubacteria bacterium]|nr:zinc ribbon domain-containing protein [Candidatus Rokubacteria bacterium]
MPTYEYHCDGCGRDFEVRQRISEDPLKTCGVCGGSVRRLLSPAPFILKGAGWYVTDYPSASRKKAMESEKGGTKEAASSGTEKSSSSSDGASTSSSSTSSSSTKSSSPSSPSPSSSSSSSS